MNFTAWDTTAGSVDGLYCSAVGNATNYYDLHGTFDTCGETIAWTVTYQNEFYNSHSTCAWSGRIYNHKTTNPVIMTTWLLTRQTNQAWESTNIGSDKFTLPYTQDSPCFQFK